jgi:hypothetical protein
MGETVVLLLEPDRIHIFDLLRIRIAGLGRLPVYVVGGKRFVETSAFFVPPNAPTSQVLIGDHTRELVPLDWLRDFVRASTAEASPVDR